MKRKKCITCGKHISKSALQDPDICRECESKHGTELERFRWLDYA